MTVYVNPDRYTGDFLKDSDTFAAEFFPPEYREALGYLGSHSGRDGDKVAAAGLTPRELAGGVTFEEANLTFVCHKLYQGEFRRGVAEEINRDVYKTGSRIGCLSAGSSRWSTGMSAGTSERAGFPASRHRSSSTRPTIWREF